MKQLSEIDIPQLVNYAQGFLEPGKAAHIKQALKNNEKLRIQYEGIIQIMKAHPTEDPEEVLEQMGANMDEGITNLIKAKPTQQRTKATRILIAVSMAAVFICAAAGLFLVNEKRQTSTYLAQQIISEKVFVEQEKGISNEAPSQWKEEFKKANFAAVISKLQDTKNSTQEEQFFLGLAYLKTEPSQPANAEVQFAKAITSSVLYKSDAWLYLGIAQLLQNKNAEAKASLQNSQHPKASELSKKID